MLLRATPPPLWFAATLFPMVASQIIRLQQPDAASWIFWDYAGRLGALAVLVSVPSARTVAFRWEHLRIARWEAVSWIIGIVLVDHYLCGWIRRTINAALPATVLGEYPKPHGWLEIVDDAFGLPLVAYSEEIVFRRCAHHLFKTYLGDGHALGCRHVDNVRCLSLVDRRWEHYRGFNYRRLVDAVLQKIGRPLASRACTLPDRFRRLRTLVASHVAFGGKADIAWNRRNFRL